MMGSTTIILIVSMICNCGWIMTKQTHWWECKKCGRLERHKKVSGTLNAIFTWGV